MAVGIFCHSLVLVYRLQDFEAQIFTFDRNCLTMEVMHHSTDGCCKQLMYLVLFILLAVRTSLNYNQGLCVLLFTHREWMSSSLVERSLHLYPAGKNIYTKPRLQRNELK